MSLILYLSPGASSLAPHIALNEIGAPFEIRSASLATKKNREPAYLALNSEGKVPTMTIDGRPLTEVAAILFYLAKRYPEANLLPAGGIESDAQAISWMSFLASTVHASRARGEEFVMTAFGHANQRLGKNEWALGTYSIVDIHLFRIYWRFSNMLKIPRGTFAALEAHHDRMMAREAVKKAFATEKAMGEG